MEGKGLSEAAILNTSVKTSLLADYLMLTAKRATSTAAMLTTATPEQHSASAKLLSS